MRSDYNKKLPIGFQCLILKYKRQRSTNIVEHLYHEKQIKQINIPKKKKKNEKEGCRKTKCSREQKTFLKKENFQICIAKNPKLHP